jgi:hypothetical protein
LHLLNAFPQVADALFDWCDHRAPPTDAYTPQYDKHMTQLLQLCTDEGIRVLDDRLRGTEHDLLLVYLLMRGLPRTMKVLIQLMGAKYLNNQLLERSQRALPRMSPLATISVESLSVIVQDSFQEATKNGLMVEPLILSPRRIQFG